MKRFKDLNLKTQRKIKFYFPYAVAILIALACFLVGTFFDSEISKAVYIKNNWFSTIFVIFGVIFTYILGMFASTVLLLGPERKTKFLTVLQRVLGVLAVLCVALIYFSSGAAIAEFPQFVNRKALTLVIVGIIYAGTGIATVLLTAKFKNKLDQNSLFVAAIMMLAILAFTTLFAEIIKYLASRPRPDLVFNGQDYRAWYQWEPLLAFKNSDCKSFYSGHAGNSAFLITGIPLFLSLTKLNFKKHTAIIGAFSGLAFSMVVSWSRMLCGDHFLSDVAVGTFMSVVWQLLVLKFCPIICSKVEKAYNKWEPKKKSE